MGQTPSGVVAVNCVSALSIVRARTLSKQLGLPCWSTIPQTAPSGQYVLCVGEQGLFLKTIGLQSTIQVDFVNGANAHRRYYGGGKGQLIARAIGLKSNTIRPHLPLNVLDLTAGLGQDGFVLATLGCFVTLVERCTVVYQLLHDGFYRAQQFAQASETSDEELDKILLRMELVEASAEDYLENIEEQPDIIYLDPMFPIRVKSAQVNKNMQALQVIAGKDDDAGKLLYKALNKARFRVVVKRPQKAPALNQQYPNMVLPEPGLVLNGKSTRYDVYFQP